MSSYIDKSKKKLAPKSVARRTLPEPPLLTPSPTQHPQTESVPETSSPAVTAATNRASPVNTRESERPVSPSLDVSADQDDVDTTSYAAKAVQGPEDLDRPFTSGLDSYETQERPAKRRRTQTAVRQLERTSTNRLHLTSDVVATRTTDIPGGPTLAEILSNQANASRNATDRWPNAVSQAAKQDSFHPMEAHVASEKSSSNHAGHEHGHDESNRGDDSGTNSAQETRKITGLAPPDLSSPCVEATPTTERGVSGSARKALKPRATQRKQQSAEALLDQTAGGSRPTPRTSPHESAAATGRDTPNVPDSDEQSRSERRPNTARGIGSNLRGQHNSKALYEPAPRDAAVSMSTTAPSPSAVIEDSAVRDALLADLGAGPSNNTAVRSKRVTAGMRTSETREGNRQKRKAPHMRVQPTNDFEEVALNDRQEVNAPGSATAAETAEDLSAAGLTKASKPTKQLKPKPVRRPKQGPGPTSDRSQAGTDQRAGVDKPTQRQPTRQRKEQPIMEDTMQNPDGERDEEDAAQASTATTDDAAANNSVNNATIKSSGRKKKRKHAQEKFGEPGIDNDPDQEPDDVETNNSSRSGRTSAVDEAEEDESGAPRKKAGRRRQETPDDAEDHEIDPKTMTMAELCKDRKRGKKSKLERDMQAIDWDAVAERRKEAEDKARAAARKAGKKAGNLSRTEARRQLDEAGKEAEAGADADADVSDHAGPQLRMEDGTLVVDQTSLIVRRHAPIVETQEAVEENDLTKKVTSATWRYDSRRDPNDRFFNHSSKWTADETNVFYGALKMFGTDFDMISKMFPGRNRRMIKLKFSREERDNEWRIRAVLLGQPDPIDFDNYCTFTGQNASDFKDPEVFKEELKIEEEKQLADLEKDRQNMVEHQKKKQAAALHKAEIARRRKNGEKVTRKRRKKVVDGLAADAAATDADAGGVEAAEGGAQQEGEVASNQTGKGRRSRKTVSKPRPRRKNLPVQLDDGQGCQDINGTANAAADGAAADDDHDTVRDAEDAADAEHDNDDSYNDGDEGMGHDHDPDDIVASIE